MKHGPDDLLGVFRIEITEIFINFTLLLQLKLISEVYTRHGVEVQRYANEGVISGDGQKKGKRKSSKVSQKEHRNITQNK